MKQATLWHSLFLVWYNALKLPIHWHSFIAHNENMSLNSSISSLYCFRCPVDYEIFGGLEYSPSKTSASVRFQAHKFPYISSVYYQCNVKLCIKNAGGCDDIVSVCQNKFFTDYYTIILFCFHVWYNHPIYLMSKYGCASNLTCFLNVNHHYFRACIALSIMSLI